MKQARGAPVITVGAVLCAAVAVALVTVNGAAHASPRDAEVVAPRPELPSSFDAGKRLMERVYADHRETFYCACAYDDQGPRHDTCGYQSAGDHTRAERIEWEHVVPAHAFGQAFPEWRDGHPTCVTRAGASYKGRRCARKASDLFRRMEADPYNLVPSVGEVNGRRSNYSMAMILGEPRRFGACDVEIHSRKIEPRPDIRGDIARIYLYMDRTYPGRGIVSNKNRPLYQAWSTTDPASPWECERYRRIRTATGADNAILRPLCQ